MEKQLSNKVENYVATFKCNVKDKIMEILSPSPNEFSEKRNMITQYVLDYEPFSFEKEDFQKTKRKKQKNTLPSDERCCSKRADQEQCSRKKRPGFDYCGTHLKTKMKTNTNTNTNTESTSSTIEDNTHTIGNTESKSHKVEVIAHDIQGIVYFLDKEGNVYKTEDIMSNKPNPEIIANYSIKDNQYILLNR
jgi:hypothetical protein